MRLNLIVGGLILVVLYVGTHAISRTDGFNKWIAVKISDNLQQTAAVKECGITPLFGMHLKGLSFEGVEVPDVKVTFNWLSWLPGNKPFVKYLRISELQVRFSRIPKTGNWEPLALHEIGSRLGEVIGVNPSQMEREEPLPTYSKKMINAKTMIQLDHAQMAWNDEQGRELAYFSDANFNVSSASLTGRKTLQSIAELGHVRLASGKLLRDLHLEALNVEGSEVVVILEMTSAKGSYPEFATQNIWQDLNEKLNALSNL